MTCEHAAKEIDDDDDDNVIMMMIFIKLIIGKSGTKKMPNQK